MNHEEIKALLATLAQTPVEVGSLITDLRASSVVIKPSPEEFSVLENVCHLRDIEIEGYAIRIQRILTEDSPTLPDLNGARLAIERDYNRQDLRDALTEFSLARRRNLAILNETSEFQFERDGDLEGVGQITLRRLVQMMCEHDEGHVDELKVSRMRLLRTTQA